jgi:CRISPR-associated protein Cse2 (CRISPR_cse2)
MIDTIEKIYKICQEDSSAKTALARMSIDSEIPLDAFRILDADVDMPLLTVAKAIAVYPSNPPSETRTFGISFRGLASSQRFESLLQSSQEWALAQLDWWIRQAKQHNRKIDYGTLLSDLRKWETDEGEDIKLRWTMDFHSGDRKQVDEDK